MADKHINIITSTGLEKFKVAESGGKYKVWWVANAVAFATHKELGSARTFEDAMMLARSYCKGTIKKVDIY